MLVLLMLLSVLTSTRHEMQLRWSAPEGCPNGTQINDRIAGYLGSHTSAQSQGAQASATVTVTTKDGKFRAQIETRFGNVPGERTLDGDSCEAVASATALILAMMIDPEAVRGVISAPPVAPPLAAPASSPVPTIHPAGETSNVQHTEVIRLLVMPSVLFGHGLLPDTAYGGSLTLALRQSAWEAGVLGSFWAEQKARLELDQQSGGRFSRLAAGPRLWRTLPGPVVSGRIGVGLDLTRTAAQGFGVSDPTSDRAWVASPLVTVGGQLRLSSHLSLRVDAETAFPLSRPRFTLIDRGEVWRAPAASVTVGCGVQLQF